MDAPFRNRTTVKTAATAFSLYILVASYPFRFASRDRIHSPIAVCLWQSSGKVEKFSFVL